MSELQDALHQYHEKVSTHKAEEALQQALHDSELKEMAIAGRKHIADFLGIMATDNIPPFTLFHTEKNKSRKFDQIVKNIPSQQVWPITTWAEHTSGDWSYETTLDLHGFTNLKITTLASGYAGYAVNEQVGLTIWDGTTEENKNIGLVVDGDIYRRTFEGHGDDRLSSADALTYITRRTRETPNGLVALAIEGTKVREGRTIDYAALASEEALESMVEILARLNIQ